MDLADTRAIEFIFQEKKWDLKTRLFHPEKLCLFDAVCQFVSTLDGDQKTLAIELIRRYEIENNYTNFAIKFSEKLESMSKERAFICVVPVLTKSSNTIKSGHNIIYDIRAAFNASDHSNVNFFDSPFSEEINQALSNLATDALDKPPMIIFVDDFIGTGK